MQQKEDNNIIFLEDKDELSNTINKKACELYFLLKNFDANDQKLFEVSDTAFAEAFGITLEPEGGSTSPTMEQLYTLGKV